MSNGDWGVEIPGGWFSEEKHVYRDENGIPVISSTQVFDVLGFNDFSAIPPAVLEFKRLYGTALHKCLQYLIPGDLDWDTVDERLIAPLTGIEMFLKKVEYIGEASEEMRVHSLYRMKYGLTLDLRGSMMYQGVRRSVVADLKTGSKFSKTWDWQLGSYIHPQLKVAGGWMGLILQVDAEGNVTPYYLKDVEAAKREFQILLAAAILGINNGLYKLGR